MTHSICGVDVSKARLDAAIAPNHHQAFANTEHGIAQLAAFCRTHHADLVVMEASGGIERRPFLRLWQHGIAAAIVNPARVRLFARAIRGPEKTDRIDAAMIAHFAQTKTLQPTPPPCARQQRLKALATRLGQLGDDITTQKQRRAATDDPESRQSLDHVIACLDTEASRIEGEIASLINDHPLWAAIAAALRAIKGVAIRTTARLLADLPEIGTWSNKAIAKLAGLAPIANDSGQRSASRHVRGGRARVRSILFLVANIARKFDPSLAQFAQRLLDQGKPKMVVRVALAHKLLVRLNAKARDARIAFANAT